MNSQVFSKPLSLTNVKVKDPFWKKEMELVRKEVIPYQWKALNDQVEGAAPSFCMHNFKVAAKCNTQNTTPDYDSNDPTVTNRGIETLPLDPNLIRDRFYGYVFQDSDFYKWIEAVGYSLTQHPDPELEALADGAIDVVCAAQLENGYLDTYYILTDTSKIFTNLCDHHELYCLGHLVEGAVAYYQATGKDKLLHAACRFADYCASRLGKEEGKLRGYPGHEIAEMALVRLYEATKNESYLNLARYFVEERGQAPNYFEQEHEESSKSFHNPEPFSYHQAHRPVREQTEAVGHAVRAVYLYSGMADIARLTQDESLFQACDTLFHNIMDQKMYLTGAIGGTHVMESFSFNYDLPNDTAYAETCAAIGLVFFARRMLEIKPDRKYADVMERALFNCVLSGMALDGKSFFYVNPLEVFPEANHRDERKQHVETVRQKWFGCACCPPNLARLISSISSYAYTQNQDTLFVHLYMGSDLTWKVNGQDLSVSLESNMPWDGNVKVQIQGKNVPATLALRIPSWASSYVVKGLEQGDSYEKDGYLYLTKTWTDTETLSIEFAMDIQIVQSHPMVRENIGKVAVIRGPVVYCLEEADNGKNLHLLTLDCKKQGTLEKGEVAGEPVIKLLLSGYRQTLPADQTSLYSPYHKAEKEEVTLHFVPYYVWANRGENEMTVWIRPETE